MINVPKGQLRRAVEKRKQFLIQKLLHHGFLQEHRLIQEFTLSELEREWSSMQSKDNVSM